MGLWGWFSSKVSAAKDWVADKARKAKDYVTEKARDVKGKVTGAWNKFTGKDKIEEANRLYEQITEKYNSKRKQFESEVDDYTNKIEKHVESINKSKEKIKTKLFIEFAKKMEKIKDVDVSKEFSIEEYMPKEYSFDSIRSKSSLYKIDFDKHKFKTTVQAVFTLGFYTRKKATETLYAVKEEEKKIDTEIAKMDAEIVRLKAIEMSLANAEFYFTSLIEMYENLLMRMDSAVNCLYVRCMTFTRKAVRAKMSVRMLPAVQQEEIKAIVTASEILKAMTMAQLTSVDNRTTVDKYSVEIKNQQEKFNDLYMAA